MTFDREKAREVREEVLDAMSWAESFTGGRIGREGAERLLAEYDALAKCVMDEPQAIHPDTAALLGDLHRATDALALELPSAVWDDYTKRLGVVIDLLRPAPAQIITRDALIRLYQEWDLLALAVSVEEAHQRVLTLLRPDPRIAKLEALLERADTYSEYDGLVETYQVRAILRGES